MARLIMAGVATVDMFDGDKLFGSATTLTESSLNIGISAEDVRGGEGAGLLGRYFHTSTFELTLTDALFNLDYIAASVGANVDDNGGDVIVNESLTADADKKLSLTQIAKPLGCGKTMAWYRLPADEKWEKAEVGTDNKINVPAAGTYCVKYFYTNAAAKKIRIASDYVPATLRLVLKIKLFAAGETNSSQTKVGYVLINIPRFQLDGSQELSMSMTGASTTSLKGMALISDGCDAGCEGAGYYADMIQVLDDAIWCDGITSLAVDGGTVTVGEDGAVDVVTNRVYAIFENKTPKLISNDMLTIKNGNNTISLTLKAADGVIELKKDEEVIASGAVVIETAEQN